MSDVSLDYDFSKIPTETRVIRKIERGDTIYEVYAGACKCGAHPVIRLMRTCGPSISVYQISEENFRDLERYINTLHESFSIDVVTKLNELHGEIGELNANGFFETSNVDPFYVRLLDKARLIYNRLSREGKLQDIIDHADRLCLTT